MPPLQYVFFYERQTLSGYTALGLVWSSPVHLHSVVADRWKENEWLLIMIDPDFRQYIVYSIWDAQYFFKTQGITFIPMTHACIDLLTLTRRVVCVCSLTGRCFVPAGRWRHLQCFLSGLWVLIFFSWCKWCHSFSPVIVSYRFPPGLSSVCWWSLTKKVRVDAELTSSTPLTWKIRAAHWTLRCLLSTFLE